LKSPQSLLAFISATRQSYFWRKSLLPSLHYPRLLHPAWFRAAPTSRCSVSLDCQGASTAFDVVDYTKNPANTTMVVPIRTNPPARQGTLTTSPGIFFSPSLSTSWGLYSKRRISRRSRTSRQITQTPHSPSMSLSGQGFV
jgi:hypothetical protein